MNSNLATLIRTGVIHVATAGIVSVRSEWESFNKLSRYGVLTMALSG